MSIIKHSQITFMTSYSTRIYCYFYINMLIFFFVYKMRKKISHFLFRNCDIVLVILSKNDHKTIRTYNRIIFIKYKKKKRGTIPLLFRLN